jgi:hypothetical protein
MSTEAGELLGIDPVELRFPCMCLLPVGVSPFLAGSIGFRGIHVGNRGSFDGYPGKF